MKRCLALVITLFCLLLPASAAAYNPLGNACAGASGAAVCSNNGTGNPIAGPHGVLEKVTLIIATIASITAIIIIIVGGLRIVSANGDSKKVADARTAIIGAIVGLVIIAAATSIITLVVSKL